MLTVKELRDRLHYDPDTGEFTWVLSNRTDKIGKRAGTVLPVGYIQFALCGHKQYAHRLAWLYMTGSWPVDQLDHINGNKSDNRWCNLREATNAQNGANRGAQRNNRTSGLKGVFRDRRLRIRPWVSYITRNRENYRLGRFDTAEEAHLAYRAAAARLHGDFAHMG